MKDFELEKLQQLLQSWQQKYEENNDDDSSDADDEDPPNNENTNEASAPEDEIRGEAVSGPIADEEYKKEEVTIEQNDDVSDDSEKRGQIDMLNQKLKENHKMKTKDDAKDNPQLGAIHKSSSLLRKLTILSTKLQNMKLISKLEDKVADLRAGERPERKPDRLKILLMAS